MIWSTKNKQQKLILSVSYTTDIENPFFLKVFLMIYLIFQEQKYFYFSKIYLLNTEEYE